MNSIEFSFVSLCFVYEENFIRFLLFLRFAKCPFLTNNSSIISFELNSIEFSFVSLCFVYEENFIRFLLFLRFAKCTFLTNNSSIIFLELNLIEFSFVSLCFVYEENFIRFLRFAKCQSRRSAALWQSRFLWGARFPELNSCVLVSSTDQIIGLDLREI
ncbi:hypothetical protein LEP1GSC062_4358 [Leptospira alexanderi serovar Manhao 3 str. L 60]|uniref:Uncharacterized protein n=1 Tax=Leptospira alexanderi serovar Manhao 3 str. L 60 TaxID=1049759 RepID=V6I2P3_9LEPT|nr:hypothetical protein LEP1GSC062_4358 [Leptospira alexanderi serovar Manhao 3 str. L 60]